MDRLSTTRNRFRDAVSNHLQKLDGLKNSVDFDREEAFTTLKTLKQLKEHLNIFNDKMVDVIDLDDIEEEIVTSSEYANEMDLKVRRFLIFATSKDIKFEEDFQYMCSNGDIQIDLDVLVPPLDDNPQPNCDSEIRRKLETSTLTNPCISENKACKVQLCTTRLFRRDRNWRVKVKCQTAKKKEHKNSTREKTKMNRIPKKKMFSREDRITRIQMKPGRIKRKNSKDNVNMCPYRWSQWWKTEG